MLDSDNIDDLKTVVKSGTIDDKMKSVVWAKRQWSSQMQHVQNSLKALLIAHSDGQPASNLLPATEYNAIGQHLETVFSQRLKKYWKTDKFPEIKQLWLQARAGVGTDYSEAYSLFMNDDVSALDTIFPYSEDDVWTMWFSQHQDHFQERINQIRDEWIIGFSTIIDIMNLQCDLLAQQPSVLNSGLSCASSELNNVIALLRLIAFPDCECDADLPSSLAHSDRKMYNLEDPSLFFHVKTDDPQSPDYKLVIDTGDDLETSICGFFRDKVILTNADRQHNRVPYGLKQRLAPIMLGMHSAYCMPKIVEMLGKSFPSLFALAKLTQQFSWTFTPDYPGSTHLKPIEEISAVMRSSDLICRWLIPVVFPEKLDQEKQSVDDICCILPDHLTNKTYCCPAEALKVLHVVAEMLNGYVRTHDLLRNNPVFSNHPEYLSWIRNRLRALDRLGIGGSRISSKYSSEYVLENLISWYKKYVSQYDLWIRVGLLLCCGLCLWLPINVIGLSVALWFFMNFVTGIRQWLSGPNDAQSGLSLGNRDRPKGPILQCSSVEERPDTPGSESFFSAPERPDTTNLGSSFSQEPIDTAETIDEKMAKLRSSLNPSFAFAKRWFG